MAKHEQPSPSELRKQAQAIERTMHEQYKVMRAATPASRPQEQSRPVRDPDELDELDERDERDEPAP